MSAGVQPGTAILLGRAERAARAAAAALECGAPELAAGRAFYAVLYAGKALLCERGVRLRAHARIAAALTRMGGADMQLLSDWLSDGVARRRSPDGSDVTHDEAAAWCVRADDAVSLIRRVLS